MNKKAILAALTVIVVLSIIMVSTSWLMPSRTNEGGATTALKGVILSGAGATFPYPQIIEWINRFTNKTGVIINYQPVGSGAGLTQFFQNVTDFACSDPPLKRSDWMKYEGRVLQVPWIIGAVVVVYNLPELPSNYNLRLTGEVIAKIYKGEIETWNDSLIKKLNPEVADKLPNQRIIVVYRSDSSGTTEVFTTFLHKSAPDLWGRELVGKVVDWPVTKVGRGVGGYGNPGVTQVILTTPYSIGYVEWGFAIANRLQVAAIANRDGRFILPSDVSLAEALRNIKLPNSPLDDFSSTLDEVIYAPGEGAYPITSPSYIILWRTYQSREKAVALSEFLRWVANEGRNYIIPGYIFPPTEVVNLMLKASEILIAK